MQQVLLASRYRFAAFQSGIYDLFAIASRFVWEVSDSDFDHLPRDIFLYVSLISLTVIFLWERAP